MSGNKAVLDSNAIIFASKQMIDVEKLYSKYDEFYTSIITYMEVYSYDFEKIDAQVPIFKIENIRIQTP